MGTKPRLNNPSLFQSELSLWTGPVVAYATAGLAFCLYLFTLAPGLTWANFGADGGELIAAAVSNGVPHPPGYPLYTLLLQGWLAVWGFLLPGSDLAWRGNLFSATAAALSVGLTAHLAYRLLAPTRSYAWLYAALAALLWSVAPLFWGQAVITEVYALHALLFSLLAWVSTAPQPSLPHAKGTQLGLIVGLGAAHHLTLLLLLPAVFYWLWGVSERPLRHLRFWVAFMLALLPGLLLYVRVPFVAALLPPVNWGYATTLSNFWWLVSGEAYRPYLSGLTVENLLPQVSQWAAVLISQYTAVGFALAIAGLYAFDQNRPRWRTFCLIWLTPVSLYMLSYNTVDSRIYLLPVVWLLALWIPEGIVLIGDQLRRIGIGAYPLLGITAGALLILTGIRLPGYSLQTDYAAEAFLAETAEVLEPDSIVFSSADAETFTLWYGVYGEGSIEAVVPNLVLINTALYQFEWYRDLLADLYPNLPGVESRDLQTILTTSAAERPVFFTEVVAPSTQEHLTPAGPIWRYSVSP